MTKQQTKRQTTRSHKLLPLSLALLLAGAASTLHAADDATRIAALQAHVAAMAKETTYVEDITKIQRLGRAFGYYTDKGFFGEAADLFADNATFQWGNDGIYKGKARIKELLTRQGGGSMKEVAGLPFGRLNLRMQLQPVVTIADDGKTAHARWREWGLLGNYQKEISWGDAIMEDDYIKDNGVWKISARRYYQNFVSPYSQGGWAALKPTPVALTKVGQEFPADEKAAEYPMFPLPYVPPYHYANAKKNTAIMSDAPAAMPKRAADAIGRLETLADQKQLQLSRTRSVRAIENLQAMYGYYIDKGQWQQASQLFSKDGSYEFGQSGVYISPAHIEKALGLMGPKGLELGQLNNFVMVQPIINISDDNRTAKARWRSDVLLSRGGSGKWGGGIYENEYVNDNGTWKFSKFHYYVTFWGDYDAGWQAKPIPMDPPNKEFPPDQPPTDVYQSYPKTRIVPFHYNNPVTGTPLPGEKE
ncbi:MAG TPA: nuclear transport factor 2 family protein [Candidatus Acidoferrum sp.]|nr:nuclear transport factor 2 family protein [Candidatus Acidoferrum sp.]